MITCWSKLKNLFNICTYDLHCQITFVYKLIKK